MCSIAWLTAPHREVRTGQCGQLTFCATSSSRDFLGVPCCTEILFPFARSPRSSGSPRSSVQFAALEYANTAIQPCPRIPNFEHVV